jgi:two-component system, OmpR family, response regulator ResD
MAHILVVDDEQKIREGLREYAEFDKHTVTEAADGMEAIRLCREQDFDIIIMDVMMPKLDGFSACKEIRKYKNIPVLMLSARGEEYDKLFGFEVGIDDYVVKPFSPKEVMARVSVIVSRSKGLKQAVMPDTQMKFGGFEIDFSARDVFVDKKKIELTLKETELLFYLVKNRNIALTREKLLTEVWGYDYYGDDRTVDTHIKMLRANLGPYKDAIVTLRGVGYKFEV